MSETMPKRQAAFREDFRKRIARFYNGPLHVLMIFSIGIANLDNSWRLNSDDIDKGLRGEL